MTTCATPGYHSSQSKWHLAPDFTVTALPEDSSISNAISIVLDAKNKVLSQTEKQIIISNIENLAGGNTIHHLYNLTENQWNNIDKNIPKLCGVYLRHLLVQSFKYKSKLQLLEHDFNYGLKIKWNEPSMKSKINQLLSIGFNFDQSAEAVIVTSDKPIDSAIDYALLDDHTKQKKYEKQKRKFNRVKTRTLNDNDYNLYEKMCGYQTFDEQKESEMILVHKWKQNMNDNNNNNHIYKEIQSYKQKVFELKQKKLQLQNKLNDHKLELYSHFVSGILANGTLNIAQISEWKKYRRNNNISDTEHTLTLNKFGYKCDDDLDSIKTYINTQTNLQVTGELVRYDSNGSCNSMASLQESTTKIATYTTNTTANSNNECVICYSDISVTNDIIYMLCPCNHICLCDECALKHYNTPHKQQKCPICCTQITDLKQVFFS